MPKKAGEAKAYEWDYDGEYAPHNKKRVGEHWNSTFTLGVFQWLPKSSKKGLKRGAVIKRFRGEMAEPDECYRKAQAYIDTLNAKET